VIIRLFLGYRDLSGLIYICFRLLHADDDDDEIRLAMDMDISMCGYPAEVMLWILDNWI